MANADRSKKLARLNELYADTQEHWIEQTGTAAPNLTAINNAKAITTLLCVIGIEHSSYAMGSEGGGIILDIYKPPIDIEIECRNSGQVITEDFNE